MAKPTIVGVVPQPRNAPDDHYRCQGPCDQYHGVDALFWSGIQGREDWGWWCCACIRQHPDGRLASSGISLEDHWAKCSVVGCDHDRLPESSRCQEHATQCFRITVGDLYIGDVFKAYDRDYYTAQTETPGGYISSGRHSTYQAAVLAVMRDHLAHLEHKETA